MDADVVQAELSKQLTIQLLPGTDFIPAVAHGTEFPGGRQVTGRRHLTLFQEQVSAELESTFMDGHGCEGTETAPSPILHKRDGETGTQRGEDVVQNHTARARVSDSQLFPCYASLAALLQQGPFCYRKLTGWKIPQLSPFGLIF